MYMSIEHVLSQQQTGLWAGQIDAADSQGLCPVCVTRPEGEATTFASMVDKQHQYLPTE